MQEMVWWCLSDLCFEGGWSGGFGRGFEEEHPFLDLVELAARVDLIGREFGGVLVVHLGGLVAVELSVVEVAVPVEGFA